LASLLARAWSLLSKVDDRLLEAERGLLGLASVAGLAALVGLLALAGSEFGESAVPLGAGALVGGGFGYLVARLLRGQRLVAGALACLSGLAVAMGLFVAASGSGWLELPGTYPEAGTVSGGLFYGFLFGFVFLVSQGLFGPLAPATPGEARERRRELLWAAVMVGAVSLVLAVLALAVFAVLALVAHVVAALYG
jgi:hypothetical protein